MKKIILIVLLIIVAIFAVRTSYMYSAKQVALGTPISATQAPQLWRNLTWGDYGSDVALLQDFLIQRGLLGAGDYRGYGSSTYSAVVAFQQSQGIVPPDGNVSALTRSVINSILASASSTVPTPTPTRLTRDFVAGDEHPEIGMVLKVFLRNKGYLQIGEGWDYVYDSVTQQAVKSFKVAQGISPANDRVDILVRTVINRMLDTPDVIGTTTTPTTPTTPVVQGCTPGIQIGSSTFALEKCTIQSKGEDIVVKIIPSNSAVQYTYSIQPVGFTFRPILNKKVQGPTVLQFPVKSLGIPPLGKKATIYSGTLRIAISAYDTQTKKNTIKYLYQKVSVAVK